MFTYGQPVPIFLVFFIFANFVDYFSFSIGFLILIFLTPFYYNFNFRFNSISSLLVLTLLFFLTISFLLHPDNLYYYLRFIFAFISFIFLLNFSRLYLSFTILSNASFLYLLIVLLLVFSMYDEGGRLHFFGDPNQFSLILTISYLYLLFFVTISRYRYIVFFSLSTVYLYLLLLTNSIGGFFSFIFIFLSYLLYFYNIKHILFLFFLFILVFISFDINLSFIDKLQQNFDLNSFSILESGTVYTRYTSILETLNYDLYLFGHGFYSSYALETPPHNFFVLSIFETGIINTVLIFLFFLHFFWKFFYTFNRGVNNSFLVFHNKMVSFMFIPFLFLFPNITDLVFLSFIFLAYRINFSVR